MELRLEIDVFAAGLLEMPSRDLYAAYESSTDAVYVWEKLERELTDQELTALATHELCHVAKACLHGRLIWFRKAIRPLQWWCWRRFRQRSSRIVARRESDADRQTIESMGFEAWRSMIVKCNLLVLEEYVRSYKSSDGSLMTGRQAHQ